MSFMQGLGAGLTTGAGLNQKKAALDMQQRQFQQSQVLQKQKQLQSLLTQNRELITQGITAIKDIRLQGGEVPQEMIGGLETLVKQTEALGERLGTPGIGMMLVDAAMKTPSQLEQKLAEQDALAQQKLEQDRASAISQVGTDAAVLDARRDAGLMPQVEDMGDGRYKIVDPDGSIQVVGAFDPLRTTLGSPTNVMVPGKGPSTVTKGEALASGLPSGSISLESDDPKNLMQLATGTPTADQLDLSKGDRSALQTRKDFMAKNLMKIDEVIYNMDQDQTRFGLMGSVRGTVQNMLQIGEDIASMFGVDMVSSARQMAEDAVANGDLDPETKASLFDDPTLSTLELTENSLAMALARTRQDDGRLLKDVIQDAKKDTKLTGFQSSQKIREKLLDIRDQFMTAYSDINKQLGAKAEGNSIDVDSMNEDQLDELMRQLGISAPQ